MSAIRKLLLGTTLSLAVAASFTIQAQADIVENPDGSVAVTIEDEVVTIPASLAGDIIDALNENAGDPPGLRVAISDLVADNAGAEDGGPLARAIAAFAAFRSGGDSALVRAIVEGALEGRPTLSVQSVLDALPPATNDVARRQPTVRSPPPPRPSPTTVRDTAENPHQVSPT